MRNSSSVPYYAISSSRYSTREFNTGADPFMVAMIIIYIILFAIYGVVLIVFPEQISNFIHDLFCCSWRKIAFTIYWKLLFFNFCCKSYNEFRSILWLNIVKERVLLELYPLKKQLPSTPAPVELGMCYECSGIFSGWFYRRESSWQVIFFDIGMILKWFGVWLGKTYKKNRLVDSLVSDDPLTDIPWKNSRFLWSIVHKCIFLRWLQWLIASL